MKNTLRRWWLQYLLRRHRIPEQVWMDCVARLPVLKGLTFRERDRLRALTGLFLRQKTFSGGGGFEVDDVMRITIAAQACLLILELKSGYYNGWREIIVYPDAFIVTHDDHDETGVVHRRHNILNGEAWDRGPVILSWADARPGAESPGSGGNVVLHEFAHKIDMANGVANGMPPLHREMVREVWTHVFSQAWTELEQRLEGDGNACIDPYAAESPAEFFAVCSEYFFTAPERLQECYPEVYRQLELFYRQAPLARK